MSDYDDYDYGLAEQYEAEQRYDDEIAIAQHLSDLENDEAQWFGRTMR